MIRRNLFARTSLVFALAFALSGCIKTRSSLKKDAENPDSGYDTKVVEAQNQQTQQVTEELRDEINRLNGRIDELQKRNEALSKETEKGGEREAKLRDMDMKIQELQASQAALIEALQKKEKQREERLAKEAKEKEVPKAEPKDVLETGKAAFRNQDYDTAIESFTKYLKYPKGKSTEEALFDRGESYFAKEQYKKAILDYSSLQEKYPKSKHLPKALLKIGLSFDSLGMKSDAKPFYQEILDKHAKSPEAKTAKAKLK